MWRDQDVDELLFWENHGSAVRDAQLAAAAAEADRLPEGDLLGEAATAAAAKIVERFRVEVPKLDRENVSFERKERQVERRGHFGETAVISQTVYIFEVPFTGEADVFSLRPNRWNSNPPRGRIVGNTLRITVAESAGPERIDAEVKSTLDDVEEYLSWHRELWDGFDSEILRVVNQRIAARADKLAKFNDVEAGLSALGFKPKS